MADKPQLHRDPTPGDHPNLHDTAGNVVVDGCWVQYTDNPENIVVGLVSNTDVFADTITVNYPDPGNPTEADPGVTPETSVLVLMNPDGTLVGYGS